MKYCDQCGAQLNDKAKFCSICGTPVAAAIEIPTVIRCKNCGESLEEGASFCANCGSRNDNPKMKHNSTDSAEQSYILPESNESDKNYSFNQQQNNQAAILKKYSAPVWILGIFFVIGMLLSYLLPNFISSLMAVSMPEDNYIVTSQTLVPLASLIILMGFSLLGIVVYNSSCKSSRHEEASLSMLYIAIPFGVRAILNPVNSAVISALYAMVLDGNMSVSTYALLLQIISIVFCIISGLISCVIMAFLVNRKIQKGCNAAPVDQTIPDSPQEINEQAETFSQKSKGVTALLCFFLGSLGIHRFYVGKIGTGLLWMFSGGMFGIGVIIDFLMILCGSFRDSTGQYIK